MRNASISCLILLLALGLTSCSREDQAQAYLERGSTLFEQGELTKARLELKNALQIDAEQPQAWLMLARAEEQAQNWRPAFQAYTRTVELDPENLPARIKLGTILVASGEREKALAEAETVLAAEPDNAGALALRGTVKAADGDLEGGAADAQAALAVDADHAEALALLAEIRSQQARPQEAKALLERAVTAHPERIGLREALARTHDALGDTEAATQMLQDIAARQPEAFAPQLLLARYQVAHDQIDAAEQTLRAAIAAAPEDRERKQMLVQFVAETQGVEAAIAELQQQIAQAPTMLSYSSSSPSATQQPDSWMRWLTPTRRSSRRTMTARSRRVHAGVWRPWPWPGASPSVP